MPSSVEQDRAEIGGEPVACKYQYTFHMKSIADSGEQRRIGSLWTRGTLSISKHITAALVTVKPGGLRELHWHSNASEWQFWIAGKGRMMVFFPVDNARTMDFNANDVGYVPSDEPHYIENTGDTDLMFLETFATEVVHGCLSEPMAQARAKRDAQGVSKHREGHSYEDPGGKLGVI